MRRQNPCNAVQVGADADWTRSRPYCSVRVEAVTEPLVNLVAIRSAAMDVVVISVVTPLTAATEPPVVVVVAGLVT